MCEVAEGNLASNKLLEARLSLDFGMIPDTDGWDPGFVNTNAGCSWVSPWCSFFFRIALQGNLLVVSRERGNVFYRDYLPLFPTNHH